MPAHDNTARITTQYDHDIVIMHEGASGGGKSEMLQDVARMEDDRVLLATHTITGEKTILNLGKTCTIEPICDDMATCYPSIQSNNGKLCIVDGEHGWFLRMDGVTHYGCGQRSLSCKFSNLSSFPVIHNHTAMSEIYPLAPRDALLI